MKKELLEYYCISIKETLNIPISVFRKDTGEMDFSGMDMQILSSASFFETGLSTAYSGKTLFDTSRMVSYYISDDDLAFGGVSDMNGKNAVYIGPCLLADLTENLLNTMMRRSNSPFVRNPEKYRDSLHDYLKTLPRISQERFMDLLRFTNVFVNRTDIPVQDFYASGFSKKKLRLNTENREMPQKTGITEDARTVRNNLLSLVRTGDREGIRSYWKELRISSPLFDHDSGSSLDILRQRKNSFIRIAMFIENGLLRDGFPERVLQEISGRYIEEAENIISHHQLDPICLRMLEEYASLIRKRKTDEVSGHPLVRKALEYIQDHIRETLRAEDIAGYAGISRSHLSRLFREELGTSIPEYIRKEKIDIAKTLLQNSDIRTIDLSYYLSFSSQSYFQNVFRKETGLTPGMYRRKVLKTPDSE